MADVAIILGSKSDLPLVESAQPIMQRFSLEYDIKIISAHRNLKKLIEYINTLEESGIKVVIAVAGLAAHLPGMVAALTAIPVIGVPVAAEPLKGIDSLLSIVQMPTGIPVATVAVGSSGIKNAIILAAEIISLSNKKIKEELKEYRESLRSV